MCSKSIENNHESQAAYPRFFAEGGTSFSLSDSYRMTTTQPHDKTDAAISAVAAFTKSPLDQFKYERSNLLRNLLHIRQSGNQLVFIYSPHTGTVYPPRGYHAAEAKPPF